MQRKSKSVKDMHNNHCVSHDSGMLAQLCSIAPPHYEGGEGQAAELPWRASCSVVSDALGPHRLYSPWDSPGQNTGVGRLSLLQGILPTQGFNPGLLHCRQILYQLSHHRSPRILEWVAYPFSSRSSWPRNWTRVFCIAGGILYQLTRILMGTEQTLYMGQESMYTAKKRKFS